MEYILSFIVTVVAGVVCHLICKWLDSDKVTSLWFKPPLLNGIENPRTRIRGFSFCCFARKHFVFLPIGIIAYANHDCKIHGLLFLSPKRWQGT